MSGNNRFVSPYLLRPLRTLEEVLGGRGRAVEPGSKRVQERQARDRQDGLCETAHRERRRVLRSTTE